MSKMSLKNNYDAILNFWLGDLNDNQLIDQKNPIVRRWFSKDKKFDDTIRLEFEKDLIRGRQGEYKNWEQFPRGRLALVILFDQFSRNIYRDTPQMFDTDSLALDLALRSIHEGVDLDLGLIERIFLYMPLEHSENINHQQLSLRQFKGLLLESQKQCPQNAPYFQYSFNYAQRHHDIIAQFNRFPHRNKILGRSSTSEELVFLKNANSSF